MVSSDRNDRVADNAWHPGGRGGRDPADSADVGNPDENPTELMRIYAPFADYLQREIGIPVQFTPVVDYAATVEGMAANKLDLVWFGGLTHVQARIRTNNT